ncbi:MAG: NAD-dependent epimerase/dehydratase family protein [Clostridia bacterium]|nr:NAD-dependent epimerase/dehydratase family protein [Clostridia bacterium]MBQ4156570.1 NAD-dependent epimerase/dehydratase family protein [Clostridia bacterium]
MFTETMLDEMLSRPGEALIEDMKKLDGDIMIVGAGGKVGPTLAIMARRAVEKAGVSKKVIAVSRFSDPLVVSALTSYGVEMVKCDLSNPEEIRSLAHVKNIIYMLGRKFGTTGNAHETWMTNVCIPAYVTEHFRDANYVVFSTGNVYPFTQVTKGGSVETDAPEPVGEYAMSCLGRERVFENAAQKYGAKVLMYRLNYAVDLRYGVLCDMANSILEGKSISLRSPAFNCVWQGYANEVALRSLLHAKKEVEYLNVTGPETVSVEYAANMLAKRLGKTPVFDGEPTDMALLSNAEKCMRLFGKPSVGIDQLIEWQAEWMLSGGRILNKPTHFEERKGKF